jgi:hypothetical protein
METLAECEPPSCQPFSDPGLCGLVEQFEGNVLAVGIRCGSGCVANEK